jgi:hypothetical protein
MPGPHPKNLINSLALAVAGGKRVAAWAKAHDVAPRTAYAWTRRPGFPEKVARLRRRILDRAVGELARRAAANAAEINKLATGAESEAVRLAAARAALADLAAIQKHLALEDRVAALEKRFDGDAGSSDSPA